jgi:hypothetical protein
MANPTSNFNWQMPTSSDLVTDLPADFEVFGQAVDTSLADLKGGTTGQVLKKNSNTDMDFVWSADSAGMTNPMTTTGDTIYSSSGSTPARLGIGSTGQVLTVSSGLPAWATPSSGGMTLISTTTLSSTSTTISSIPSTYTNLQMVFRNAAHGTTSNFFLRFNGVTSNSYSYGFNNNPALSGYFGFDNGAAPVTTATYNSIVNIYDYANTATALCKQVDLLTTYAMNATPSYANLTITGGFFNSAAISSITISTISGAGTLSGSVLLYGVK